MGPRAAVKKLSKFDTKTFLSTIDGGRKIVAVPKKQTLFVQGDSSNAVFYIQKVALPGSLSACAPRPQ
jgi:hypothetical protein